jgi:AcrR family transcriptional regulator
MHTRPSSAEPGAARPPRPPRPARPSRQEQKAKTRQALLDTALRVMEHQSLTSLGLREITRAVGIVPTAFYRHFPDVESLGVALVEQCLGSLRTTIRAVREGMTDSEDVINRSFEVLAREVHAHRDHFRFIARERHGGVPRVRAAIREQLDMFAEELATDLAGNRLTDTPALNGWRPGDLRMISTLIVNHMVWTAAALLDVPPGDSTAERQVIGVASQQLHLIVLGCRLWPGQP